MNKLLNQYTFIPFNLFTTQELENAITYNLENCKKQLEDIKPQIISSWENIIEPIHFALYQLNQVWGILGHLLSVSDTRELRDLQKKLQPSISEFYVNLGQNEILYTHYKNIKSNEFPSLNKEQQKVIDNDFRDFFLNGIELTADKKKQFKAIQNNLMELSTQFEQNLLDSTDNYSKYVDLNELKGIPEDILNMYKEMAIKDNKNNLYKITLHMPSYLPIMQYCENRLLREELYYQYSTRASELSENIKLDNTKIIKNILNLRKNKATLLGFNNFSELSLYTKMANSNKQVIDFLYKLVEKFMTKAKADLQELKNFAKDKYQLENLEAYDIAYFSEKLQEEKYSYSNNELKKYFQLPVVLCGLFKLIKQLYNIEFEINDTIPKWHKDVQTYTVLKNKKIIGYLYLDLFARNSKKSGAWMNSAQDKFKHHKAEFLPIAYVVCNFTQPLNNQSSLLTFDDVQTLFHEMGHALHHLLTEISHFAISGTNGVEWDAVELPSQFMEYFAWNYNILSLISKHIDNNNILPLELYNKLLKSRFFQSGLQMLRQLEFAIFDIILHSDFDPDNSDYLELLNSIREKVAVIIPPKYNRFPNSFSHIFAGGYAAGYYSYKWAEVLATDIFSEFDDKNLDKYPELGNKFYQTILSKGGLSSMMDNFKEFMGREPNIDALLKYSGILA
ncbi:MAG TPA: M3 family metallopeptidase [Burkholderiales bacterium]|nr:M3 family metallopeptidase [Burkholderiales bacterium]